MASFVTVAVTLSIVLGLPIIRLLFVVPYRHSSSWGMASIGIRQKLWRTLSRSTLGLRTRPQVGFDASISAVFYARHTPAAASAGTGTTNKEANYR